MGAGPWNEDVFEDVLDVVVLVDPYDLVDEDERSLARGASAHPNDNLGRMEGSINDFSFLSAASGSLATPLTFWEL